MHCATLTALLGLFAVRTAPAQTAPTIDTVAGSGSFGFSGDGGLATSAELGFPWGIALDGAGNV
jgi:hypothetical protein